MKETLTAADAEREFSSRQVLEAHRFYLDSYPRSRQATGPGRRTTDLNRRGRSGRGGTDSFRFTLDDRSVNSQSQGPRIHAGFEQRGLRPEPNCLTRSHQATNAAQPRLPFPRRRESSAGHGHVPQATNCGPLAPEAGNSKCQIVNSKPLHASSSNSQQSRKCTAHL